MRIIKDKLITKTVKELCIKANLEMRKDILSALKLAKRKEKNAASQRVLDIIIYNAVIAAKKKLPICQDTGMVVVYLEMGQAVNIKGDLRKAVSGGVKQAYRDGYFRKSVVMDPLTRKNTNNNLPPIIYTEIVPGRKIGIKVVIKGFGCENVSRIRMFRPTDDPGDIEDFVVDVIKDLGRRACPPLYVGVGIGGTLDKAVMLSREAILRPVNRASKFSHIAKMEKSILKKVNALKIGPAGVGGKTTALGVSILTYPTHIAGLPVAVNISCHATRDAGKAI